MGRLLNRFGWAAACWMVGSLAIAADPQPAGLKEVAPASVGVDVAPLEKIDGLVADAIGAGDMPGCVVLVGFRSQIVFLKAYGQRQVEPQRIDMTTDAVFDLASLTKPIATATAIMRLVDQGKLAISDPVAKHIPEFAAAGKEAITVEQLLIHQSSLIPDNAIGDYQHGVEEAWNRIYKLKPTAPPGTKFVYSDVNFLVLGKLVEKLSGKTLHEFTQQEIYGPLGMTETGYLPSDALKERAAPTEKKGDHWLKGEVHDPRAALLGGVAGHAGLFSTARDLAIYADAMSHHGRRGDVQILTDATWQEMIRPRDLKGQLRGLGWDEQSGFSSNRGKNFGPRSFGHGGFTGTAFWVDPDRDLFVVFLSNRLHPDGKGAVNQLAGKIGTLAGEAVDAAPPAAGR